VVEGAAGWEDFWQQEGVALVGPVPDVLMALPLDALAIMGQLDPHCILNCAACWHGIAARTGEAASANASRLATSFVRRIIPVNLILCPVREFVCDSNHILGASSRAAFEGPFS
jgi:hypothetical protein